MLCTYTRTFLQNNNLLFRTQRYEIGQWSIETLKDSGTIKAFIHDMWQIYGRNWIRFDQNEKNLALFVGASWKKKSRFFYYFSRLYLHTFFQTFFRSGKTAKTCCSVRTLSFVRGISLHNLHLYTPVVRATSVPSGGGFLFSSLFRSG